MMNGFLCRGRNVREIEFDANNKIGQYPSYDLFGDGSFYILDVPGVSWSLQP